ncbi:hypothetical protein BH11ARM2_BH11ARM2_10540 [soil metagenome]
MKRQLLILAVLATGLVGLAGCDPAPSTKLAPDVKMPDTSKMTGAEIMRMKNGGAPPDSSE